MECCLTLDVFRVWWLQSHIIYSIKTASYHQIYKKNPFYSRVTIKKSLTCNIKLYRSTNIWHGITIIQCEYPFQDLWFGNTECRQYRRHVKHIEIWDRVHVAKKSLFRVAKSEFWVDKREFWVDQSEFRVAKSEFRVVKSKFRVAKSEFRVVRTGEKQGIAFR